MTKSGLIEAVAERTPHISKKDTLIRAMRRGAADDAARREYETLVGATGGVGLRLERRL
jgi:hypothetical protein